MPETTTQSAQAQPSSAGLIPMPTGTYDSGWVAADNKTNHNVVFEHGLGKIPTAFTVYFTGDKKTVYPLFWKFNDKAGNPVTISADERYVTLAIYDGASLHGVWDATTGKWTEYNQGYFRVYAAA